MAHGFLVALQIYLLRLAAMDRLRKELILVIFMWVQCVALQGRWAEMKPWNTCQLPLYRLFTHLWKLIV